MQGSHAQPTRSDLARSIAAIPCAAFVCDENGRIVAHNTHAQLLWGREPDLNDAPWMARALGAGKDCEGVRAIVEKPDGSRVETIASAQLLHDREGQINGAVGLLFDVSGMRREVRRKDEFLAMLGHDLRNPLGPIRNAMQIMRAEGPSKRASWALDLAERQIDELVSVVDAATEISSMSRGLVKPADDPFAITDAVKEAVQASGPMLARRQQTCRVLIPLGMDAAHGDRKRVEQAVRTMLRCVSRALPSGAPIAVTAAARNGRWTISTAPAAPSQSVADRAAQLQKTPPMSVGLMLLRALAALLNATVTVRPAGGDGYEYELALPR